MWKLLLSLVMCCGCLVCKATPPASPPDFNGDSKSDLVWTNSDGSVSQWLMNGTTPISQANFGPFAGWSLFSADGDLNGDGKSDLVWTNTNGAVAIWLMNGATPSSQTVYGPYAGWSLLSANSDFDGDGTSDLLWINSNGQVSVWLMNASGALASTATFGPYPGWTVLSGNNDFDGDGKSDLLWTNANGAVSLWLMNGTTVTSQAGFGPYAGWSVVSGSADYNGDGKSDLLWTNSNGAVAVWLMNGQSAAQTASFGPYAGWSVLPGKRDFNHDGKSDLLWTSLTGAASVWLMNGTTPTSQATFGPYAGWSVVNARGDYDGDGKSDLLWANANGTSSVWLMNGVTPGAQVSNGPYAGWNVTGALSSHVAVSTLAGLPPYGAADGSGTAASFWNPGAVAVDAAGNVYVADMQNNEIRKVTPAGLVSTFAGSTTAGSADGQGSAAGFNAPSGVAVDASGNVYVADAGNNEIRKISATGLVSTLAGSTTAGFANGSGGAARFSSPRGVAVDGSGTLYVADTGNNLIRVVTSAGVASNLPIGFSGPWGVAVDAGGTLYVANAGGNDIFKVSPAGTATLLAGSGNPGSANGTGTAASFYRPTGVAVDASGNVYVADYFNNLLRMITPAGVVTTFATGFWFPEGVALDPAGNVYVADSLDYQVRKVSPAGVVTVLAGQGPGGSTDGTGSSARFFQPAAVAVDGSGNAYVADSTNGEIRRITPAGEVTTFAGSTKAFGQVNGTGTAASFEAPVGIAVDTAGNLYVGDTLGNEVRKITPAALVSTFAGSATAGSADGTGTAAGFDAPHGLVADPAGNVYVADLVNSTIRKITSAGVVSTLAGTALQYGSTNGTGAAARFVHPAGVALDLAGNLFVADSSNNQIRKITSAGTVTTFAGSTAPGWADGSGSAPRFTTPSGVAVDAVGNTYVADSGNNVIRRITPAGVVTTIAGNSAAGSADGIGSTARFNDPVGIAVDSLGTLYVVDMNSNTIRKLQTTSP